MNNLQIVMLGGLIHLYLLGLVFGKTLPKKKNMVLRLCLALAPGLAYVLLFPMYLLDSFIHVPLYLDMWLMLLLCYELSPASLLFIGTACCTITNLGSLLGSTITLFFPETFAHFGIDIALNYAGLALDWTSLGIVLLMAYVTLIRRFREVGVQRMATGPIVAISLVMLIVNAGLAMYFELHAAPDATFRQHLLEYIWNILCCIFCLCIQFGIFERSRTETELEIARHLMAEREQQFRISKSTMEAVNRKSHDLKYQLLEMSRSGSDQGKIDEALSLVDSFDSGIRTGNETLDVIFTEKNQYCQKHNINLVCMIDGALLGFMDTTDQYVMFGNIIDNAIQAVRKIEHKESRTVYITVRAENRILMIRTENAFVGDMEFRDGLPRTTSGDELNHGYGMTSVRMIAEKYGGSLSTKAEQGVFYLNIIIPLRS